MWDFVALITVVSTQHVAPKAAHQPTNLPKLSELSASHPQLHHLHPSAQHFLQLPSMPAAAYRFLTAAQVQRLHARHVARASPTQPAMLESAAHSPVTHHRYGETDLFRLCGVLAGKLILNHPFQDGNKRTALFAADLFLRLNGRKLQMPPAVDGNDGESDKVLADAYVAVATRQWTLEDLGRHHASIAKPVKL